EIMAALLFTPERQPDAPVRAETLVMNGEELVPDAAMIALLDSAQDRSSAATSPRTGSAPVGSLVIWPGLVWLAGAAVLLGRALAGRIFLTHCRRGMIL